MASNSRRIALNTIYMYIRMVFLMIISLYTSRVVIDKLGIDDYGIYNVVGSIVVMFASLRSIFASSTQRFFNFELGKGNIDNVTKVFNISLQINSIIAIILLILIEIIGLWFINNKINISPDRVVAAHFVLQFSLLSAITSVFTTSFDALIIAHERMSFYAYVSIFEGIMKLLICFILKFFYDKLVTYGFLNLITVVIVLLINIIYCKLQFKEAKFRKTWDKEYFINMTKFAGWNFLGNTSYTLSQNGINMVLNIYGGPVVNAARGISFQVTQILQQITNNISIVLKPFTIKSYAEGKFDTTFFITNLSSKIYFIIQLQVVIVFSFYLPNILQFWLGQIPEYVERFLIILLWHSLLRSLHSPIDILFYAVGNLKKYQIFESILLFLPLPITYILLHNGFPFYTAFLSMLIMEIINYVVIILIASKDCGLNIGIYFKEVVSPCVICLFIYLLFYMNQVGVLNIFTSLPYVSMLASSFVTMIFMISFGFNKEELKIFKGFFNKSFQ